MMLPSKFAKVVDGQGFNFGSQTNQQFVPGTKFLCAALWWCAQSLLKSARSSAQHNLVLLKHNQPWCFYLLANHLLKRNYIN